MEHHQRFSFSSDVILQPGHDCALVVNLTGETIYSANETGACVLRLIAERLSLNEMISTLSQEYHVTAGQLDVDLKELLHSLLDQKIIVKETSRDG